jgi:hypothetical protein
MGDTVQYEFKHSTSTTQPIPDFRVFGMMPRRKTESSKTEGRNGEGIELTSEAVVGGIEDATQGVGSLSLLTTTDRRNGQVSASERACRHHMYYGGPQR